MTSYLMQPKGTLFLRNKSFFRPSHKATLMLCLIAFSLLTTAAFLQALDVTDKEPASSILLPFHCLMNDWKTPSSLTATLASVLDTDIPTIRCEYMRKPSGLECIELTPDSVAIYLCCYSPLYNHGWITAADMNLPCFASDYDHAFKKIIDTYGDWKGYHEMRWWRSLRGLGNLGFISLLEWVEIRRRHRSSTVN